MPFYACVLRSRKTGGFYVGPAESLQKRLFEHNNNRTDSIKDRGPWELVYFEGFATRSEAIRADSLA